MALSGATPFEARREAPKSVPRRSAPQATRRWGTLANVIRHSGAISFGTMPLISVVIPVHGVEDYLDRCLDSVLSPAGEAACGGGAGEAACGGGLSAAVEVIAVDDASPDRCGAILAARRDPRLRVLTTTTAAGPGPARDLGAKEATGEYVWFVDGDDEVADGALAAVAGALTRLRPDVLVIDFESLYPDGSVSPSGGAPYLRGSGAEPLHGGEAGTL